MIPGEGIGSELCNSVVKVFKDLHVPVKFEILEKFKIENQEH